GQREPVGPAGEELRAERGLERAEPPPDRRVLDAELARGPRERPRARNREEMPEIVPVEHPVQDRTHGVHTQSATARVSARTSSRDGNGCRRNQGGLTWPHRSSFVTASPTSIRGRRSSTACSRSAKRTDG